MRGHWFSGVVFGPIYFDGTEERHAEWIEGGAMSTKYKRAWRLLTAVLLVLAIVSVGRNIYLNRRFPEPRQVWVEEGEALLFNGCELTVTGSHAFLDQEDMTAYYDKPKWKIWADVYIENTSSSASSIVVRDIRLQSGAWCGYMDLFEFMGRNGDMEGTTVTLMPGESCWVEVPFSVYYDPRLEEMYQELKAGACPLSLVYTNYPVKNQCRLDYTVEKQK